MVAPREASENLQRLARDGREGAFGFYEAVDYTPSRLPPDESSATVRSYMAHHQGMSLLALVSLLRDLPMQRRFMSRPLLKAADLLLQERLPKTEASVLPEDLDLEESRPRFGEGADVMRVFKSPGTRTPEIHLLSNGRYHVAISNAGGGYSRWRDLAITRWREDATRDCWGNFVYLRDPSTGEFWSVAYQPTLRPTEYYQVTFTEAKAEFRQRRGDLEIHTEICVSPEDDVEVRRVSLTNHSGAHRSFELTSYAEIVLAIPWADLAHPVFSNLFVQTEFLRERGAILCTRRPRSETEERPWLLHLMVTEESGEISCETDRARFIGRGRSAADPAAMRNISPLSNTVGSVLDPIVSLRGTFALAPNETRRVAFVLGATESRDAASALIEKYQKPSAVDRSFDLAGTRTEATLRQLGITETEAEIYAQLAGALIYVDPVRRADSNLLLQNQRGQNGLWSYGISGNLPIVLLRIRDANKIEIVKQLIQAHSYWRSKALAVDLLILIEDASESRQFLYNEIIGLIALGRAPGILDKPAGIFVRHRTQIPEEDQTLLAAAARIVLTDRDGTLAEQLHRPESYTSIAELRPTQPTFPSGSTPVAPRELVFQNGFGGFTPDGCEYVITLESEQTTPAPWVNVIANPNFGTVISESGGAYTWSQNCHELRLTPWNNDPVTDATGESFYLRDEQSGDVWSPTPGPARGATPYVIRHGFGFSAFEHTENGIISELTVYVAIDVSIKFAALTLRNVSGRARRISVTGYWEWVFGDLRQNGLLHVQTEVEANSGALLARNPYNAEFSEWIAFVDVDAPTRTLTGDRKEFLGRNGDPSCPAALKREHLSGRTGADLDPCGAMQITLDLPDGQERETCFRLGAGRGLAEVQDLIQRFRGAQASGTALEAVRQYWKQTLGTVQVETPDPSVNLIANGWLFYQTLSCRLWGRTGFYQSGGAFGFRDQLQDVLALVPPAPALTREHLLR